MPQVRVQVRDDHLQSLARVRKPIFAIAELVWNSLDADATEVAVVLARDELGRLEAITVQDNGNGMAYGEIVEVFGNLGGSWKRQTKSRLERRILHGKAGKGRFRAFSLGGFVRWDTCYRENGGLAVCSVSGTLKELGTFDVAEARTVTDGVPGTTVTVTDINRNMPSLLSRDAQTELAHFLALYLTQYSHVTVTYDGLRISAQELVRARKEIDLTDAVRENGFQASAILTILEWRDIEDRGLYLCDEDGFARSRVLAGIHAPGRRFTAYVKSPLVRQLEEDNALSADELVPEVNALVKPAREAVRRYFREESARDARELVDKWKAEGTYPYQGRTDDPVEQVERQVFDVVALNISSYVPDFEDGDAKGRRLSFRLLRSAIERGPAAVQTIIFEVLDLPPDKQTELAELLQTTSLSGVISAARLVADRLDFLRVLEMLLFNDPHRARFRERSQLHRLLEDNTWIFGEQFALSVSDQSLTEVLRKHIEKLGRGDLVDQPVPGSDGHGAIVDLMLSRNIPAAHRDRREHLVVELKRPSVRIDDGALTQVRNYAFAVADDERFRDTDTTWVFWALSDDCTPGVRRQADQPGNPFGRIHRDDKVEIWVKTWGEVLQSCRQRLALFQQYLRHATSDENALAKVRSAYAKYLPGSALH